MDKALYKKILNKAYGRYSTDADRMMAISTLYHMKNSRPRYIVPRETMEKGDDNMEQRKFKVGDKVRVLYGGLDGMIGKIAFVRNERAHVPYVVVFDENINMLGQDVDAAKQAIQKGYDYRKCWIYDCDELELVEEEEMTPFESLLNHWGIEVGEEFNIEGEQYNPYYFDYDGYLFDCCNDDAQYQFAKLLTGKRKIQKIEPAKEITIAEIEKELGYAIKVVKEEK